MKQNSASTSATSRVATMAARYTPQYCGSLLAANPQACEALYDRIMKGKAIADMIDHATHVLRSLEDGPKSGIQVAVWCRANGDPGMEGELAKRICDRLVREGKAFKDGQVYSAAAVAPAPTPTERENERLSVETGLNEFEWVAPPKPAPTTSQEAAPIRRANASTKTDVRVVARRMQPGREPSIWPDILEQCEKLEIGQSTNVDVPAGKFRNVFAQDIRNRLNVSTSKQWLWNVAQSDGDAASCVVTKRALNPKFHGSEPQVNDAVLPVSPAPLADAFGGTHSSIYDSLYAAVSHIDIKIAALQADRDRLIDMAQRFQETT